MHFQTLERIFYQRIFVPHVLLLFLLSTSIKTSDMSNTERSFLMIKPDGVQRGLVGDIIKRFEAKGFKLVAMKFMWVSENNLQIRLKIAKLCKW